jgi:hypothetical protein
MWGFILIRGTEVTINLIRPQMVPAKAIMRIYLSQRMPILRLRYCRKRLEVDLTIANPDKEFDKQVKERIAK